MTTQHLASIQTNNVKLELLDDGATSLVDLKTRTKQFALRVVRLFVALPKTTESQVLGRQLLRSGTSVGAHYREGCRARSTAEFISKVEGALAELEETTYWLELLVESGMLPERRLAQLRREANELTAILVSCVKTAKGRKAAGRKSKDNA